MSCWETLWGFYAWCVVCVAGVARQFVRSHPEFTNLKAVHRLVIHLWIFVTWHIAHSHRSWVEDMREQLCRFFLPPFWWKCSTEATDTVWKMLQLFENLSLWKECCKKPHIWQSFGFQVFSFDSFFKKKTCLTWYCLIGDACHLQNYCWYTWLYDVSFSLASDQRNACYVLCERALGKGIWGGISCVVGLNNKKHHSITGQKQSLKYYYFFFYPKGMQVFPTLLLHNMYVHICIVCYHFPFQGTRSEAPTLKAVLQQWGLLKPWKFFLHASKVFLITYNPAPADRGVCKTSVGTCCDTMSLWVLFEL